MDTLWKPSNLTEYCLTNNTTSNCLPSTLTFLTLIVNLLGNSTDSNFTQKPEPKEYDFIIIGGGTAGSILANRLTEISEWNVLLLEAGVEEPKVTDVPAFTSTLIGSNLFHYYLLEREEKSCRSKPCTTKVGKVMGGSSAINCMMYIRGNREDYNKWAELGNIDWNYDEVLKYFKKSENNLDEDVVAVNQHYHETGGYQSVQRVYGLDETPKIILNALQELGYNKTDPNSEKHIGAVEYQFAVKNGVRQSTNTAFIRPIRTKRSNLVIKTESYVKRIIIDPKTKRAIGVEFVSSRTGTSQVVYAKKEVIVSAGTLSSPKILMLSGIGPKEELEKHNISLIFNSSVGRNLHNHVKIESLVFSLANKTLPDLDQKVKDLENYLKSHTGPLSTVGPLSAGAFFKTKYENSKTAPDIQFAVYPKNLHDSFIGSNIPTFEPFSYYDSFVVCITLLTPKSRGFILLNGSDPIFGNPLIYPGYYQVESDLDIIVEGMQIAMKLADTKSFQENGYNIVNFSLPACKQFKFGTREYWRCVGMEYTTATHHFVGTCKMGPKSDSEAVVDPRLRVHGISGLRVVDASIIPVVIRGNTNAPAMMIAEKASDMIKEDWLPNL